AYDVPRFHLSPTGNFLYKVDTSTAPDIEWPTPPAVQAR
ncbi:TPA: tail fiber assembly protein, partial [Escherichia coli]